MGRRGVRVGRMGVRERERVGRRWVTESGEMGG